MTALVFVRLYPPRPLTPDALEQLLRRLASDPTSAPVVLEARSTPEREASVGSATTGEVSTHISYWLGTQPKHARWLRRTLHDLLPGIIIDNDPALDRAPMETAARLVIRPPGLALASDQPEAVSLALLSALHQQLAEGECLVLQVVIGPRRTPRHARQRLPDPAQPWWQLLGRGRLPAPASVVRQHGDRVSRPGMSTCIRVGVTARTSERRRRLLTGLLGAASTAKSPGVFVSLRRETADRLNGGHPPRRWGFTPSASELVGLLAWPLGERDLPGLPPLHPKLLPASPTLRAQAARRTAEHEAGERGAANERLVGVSTVPGDPTPIPISPGDSLFHLIATGPTGSGKSTALLHLIRADIHGGRPVAVIDPKQQLIDDIVDRAVPAERMKDIVILDPSDTVVPGLNPLDVGDRDPDVVVDGLLAVFAAVFAEGWGPRTQDITHAGLVSLARTGRDRQARGEAPYTLLDLPRLFTDAPFRRSVIGHVTSDPALGAFWAWYDSLQPGAQAAAIAAPSNKWRQYLMRPSVRRVLGQPEPAFRLRDIFRENKIVLVALNDSMIGPITARLIGGLMVAELWAATLERAGEENPTSRPASVWIDEVQNYLHLPTSLDDALAAARSMGVAWNLAHQFRAQMPPAMLAAVDSNARNKLVFRPNDPKDAAAYDRMATELQPHDFLSLGRYEAYATVVSGSAQQPWCSLRTLPSPEPTGLGPAIRRASRETYGDVAPPSALLDESKASATPPTPIGRKRREARS